MVFGLFGGTKRQEQQLRSSLSLHKFEAEFPRLLERFKIEVGSRASKSARYNEIEAVCRFVLTNAMLMAAKDGNLKNAADMAAAGTFSAAMCAYFGANGGLSDDEVRELQGAVPANVFPKAAGNVLSSAKEYGTAVSIGLLKHQALRKKSKSNRAVADIEDVLEQFLCNRDVGYLSIFGRVADRLK